MSASAWRLPKLRHDVRKRHGYCNNLSFPHGKRDRITMDFITKLPRISSEYDSIWVIINPCKEDGEDDLGSSMEVKVLPKKGGYGVSIKMDMTYPCLQFLVNGVYVAKEPGMIKYLEKMKNLASAFEEFFIKQVPIGENKKADALCKMASTSFAHLSKQYLTEEILLEEKRKARANRRKAEAKHVAAKTGAQVKKFVWDNIVCKFGLPSEIISKNGKQFRDNPFKDWCEKLCIRQCFSSVKYPQANGLVKRANRSLSEGIKARLDKKDRAAIQEAKIKAKIEKYYNARVRSTSFRPRDLVYRNNKVSRAEDRGKLGPKWKGPYEVTEAMGKGAYKLRDRNENTLPRT
nr:reverse transcriptase domain-containing protein [Tanacetum cinerariifolium]